jgi:LysM repeat protein
VTATGPAVPGAADACPYLGLVDDPATHFAFPSGAQRCHAGSRPLTIDHPKQARDCLTAAHVTCPLYRPVRAPTSPPPAQPAPQAPRAIVVAAGVQTERVRPEPPVEPGHREILPALRRPGRGLLVFALALAATVLVGTLLGMVIVAQLGRDSPTPTHGAVVATPSPSVAAATGARPTSSPTPAPTDTASAAPSPTPGPSAAATERPRPSPTSDARVYSVRRGDTLTSIAARYGVTVAAILRVNEIDDPNLIIVGQKLVIPTS